MVWLPCQRAHLLFGLLLHLLEVGSQVHGHLVLPSQQRLQHGVRRHAHLLQGRLLHAGQLHHLQLQVLHLAHKHQALHSSVSRDQEW